MVQKQLPKRKRKQIKEKRAGEDSTKGPALVLHAAKTGYIQRTTHGPKHHQEYPLAIEIQD